MLSTRHSNAQLQGCGFKKHNLLPGERNVTTWHFLKVIDWCRLASEAVVGVVVCHDGGGPQLTELAVWALQLQLNRLQLGVLPPVHWWDGNERVWFPYWDIHSLKKPNKTKQTILWTHLFVENDCWQPDRTKWKAFKDIISLKTCTTAITVKLNLFVLWDIESFQSNAGFVFLG